MIISKLLPQHFRYKLIKWLAGNESLTVNVLYKEFPDTTHKPICSQYITVLQNDKVKPFISSSWDKHFKANS